MIESTAAVGDTISVRAGVPRSYGRPLGRVVRINATTVTVALFYDLVRGDHTTRLVPHTGYRLAHRADPRPWVVVGCGARKAEHPAPIADLYTGSYHAQCVRAATRLTDRSRVVILSGRYGLVRLTDPTVREPYEQRIDQPGAVTTDELHTQGDRLGLSWPLERVIVLAGKAYTAPLLTVVDHRNVELPFDGTRGIGDHKALLRLIETTGTLPRRESPSTTPQEVHEHDRTHQLHRLVH